MLAVLLILTPVAFAGGFWLAARSFPDRPDPRAGRVIDLLVASATALAAIHLWRIARALFDDDHGFDRADSASYPLTELLFFPPALIGLAVIVDYVATRRSPPPRSPE
jgi:hypothetical protein